MMKLASCYYCLSWQEWYSAFLFLARWKGIDDGDDDNDDDDDDVNSAAATSLILDGFREKALLEVTMYLLLLLYC